MSGPWEAFAPSATPPAGEGPWSAFAPAGGANPAQAMPQRPQRPEMRSYPVPPEVGDAAPAPDQDRSWLGRQWDKVNEFARGALIQSDNLRVAGRQGTNPNVYHGDGQYLRPRLGTAIFNDAGEVLFEDASGNVVPTNSKQHVVLKDPASGRMTVFARVPEWDEGRIASLGRLVGEGAITGPLTGPSRNITLGSQTAAQTAATRATDIAEDIAAADRLGVRQFGPAYASAPVRGVAKQVSELPVIGDTTRNALEETITGISNAANRTADAISPVNTFDQAGVRLQSGLDRFRNARLADLEPGVVEGMGIPSMAPVPRQTVMSAGAAQTAQQAAPIRQQIGANVTQTTRGANVPAAQPMTQTLSTRTSAEMLDDAQLARVIRAPAAETSFAARQEALYERAWRMLPPLMRENNTANPMMVPAVNTRQALGQIDNNIASQIAGQGRIGGELAERLRNPRSANFQLADLRAIRTEVGRALGNTNPLQQTLDRTQLNQLYGAISRDIEVGLETIANRAALATQRGGNRADRLTVEQARQAAGALRAFRTADRYTRAGMARMDRFTSLLNANNPEQAVQRLIQAGQEGGRGNIQLIQTARAALRNDEWADISALSLRAMGTPLPSARGIAQEVGFSPQTFMTRWERMDPRALNMLYGNVEHVQAINDLVRTVNRIANVEAMTNTSRSASNAMSLGGVMAAGGAVMSGADAMTAALGTAGTGLVLSVLLSRPSYARWTAQYAQLRAAALRQPLRVDARMVTHLEQLRRMAETDSSLRPVYEAVRADNAVEDRKDQPQQKQGPPGINRRPPEPAR